MVETRSKLGKRIIVITVICIVLIAAGGIVFLSIQNKPRKIINEAMENHDLQTVDEWFPKLKKEKDVGQIKYDVFTYCQSIYEKYREEEIEYDQVADDFQIVSENVLKEDVLFHSLKNSLEELHASKEAYKQAETYLAEENYEKAYYFYKQVVTDDIYYDEVQKKIEICESVLTPPILGVWECDLETLFMMDPEFITDNREFKDKFGVDLLEIMSRNMRIYVTFEKDKMILDVEIDMDTLIDEFVREFVKFIITVECEELHISEKEFWRLMKAQNGIATFDELCEMYKQESGLNELNELEKLFMQVLEDHGSSLEEFRFSLEKNGVSLKENEFTFKNIISYGLNTVYFVDGGKLLYTVEKDELCFIKMIENNGNVTDLDIRFTRVK